MPIDTRPRVVASKPVNLTQLSDEVQAPLSASLAPDRTTVIEIVAVEGSNLTQAQLQSAYNAHIAEANYGKPDEDVALSGVRTKAQAVIAGTDTFTPAQQQRILAHLILRLTRNAVQDQTQ